MNGMIELTSKFGKTKMWINCDQIGAIQACPGNGSAVWMAGNEDAITVDESIQEIVQAIAEAGR